MNSGLIVVSRTLGHKPQDIPRPLSHNDHLQTEQAIKIDGAIENDELGV